MRHKHGCGHLAETELLCDEAQCMQDYLSWSAAHRLDVHEGKRCLCLHCFIEKHQSIRPYKE